MSHRTYWHIERRVVICDIQGSITLPELQDINHEVEVLMEQGEAPVHVIAAIADLTDYPRNLAQIRNTVDHFRHPSMGWEVIAGHQNSMVRFLVTIVSQVSGVNLHMVNTVKEADDFLSRMDSQLSAE